MLTDLKYALRQIVKSPGYTIVVVLTLAFGIAVNTQIFGMVSSMFLEAMPVRDSGRLTAIITRNDVFPLPQRVSFLDFIDLRAGSKTLTDFTASFSAAAHVSIPGRTPERAWVDAVTPDSFATLGVTTILGRPLQAGDGEMPPGTPVAVLTHRYWQNHFGSDPDIVGRTVLIDAKPFTIVGVAQAGFHSFSWALTVDLFVPSGTFPQLSADGDAFFKYRSASAWRVLAYRRPGVTIAGVNAELAVFARRFAKDFPEEHRNTRFQAVPEQRARPDPAMTDFAPVFAILFSGLVALVLFIACANVANLMSARALDREKELVVRAALGASRFRLIRQLLVESILLAVIAGLVGYLLAVWGGDALRNFTPPGDGIPIRTDRTAGWQLWAFTAGISLIAGLASGLFPALRSSRIDLNEGLKQGAGRQIGGGGHRLRNLLVIGQVAISCVVLISAALFLRGLNAAHELKLGFNPDRLLMLSFDLNLQGYKQERGLHFEQQLLERVRALPGVESASFAQHLPFNYNILIRDSWPDNPTGHVPDGHLPVALSGVEPGFVKMMGIPLLRGRDLLPTDDERAPPVAVINEAMAKAFWPGREAIGQHFRMWQGAPAIEVVGVTATGKYVMLTEEPKPYFYRPLAQFYGMPGTLVVRTAGDPHGLVHSLRETVRALDADLPVYSLITLDEHMNASAFALMPLRAGAVLAAVQGSIGLLLAILGLYAVVSYGVTNRTREIGVRMALGATNRDVLRLVSREGLRLTCIGLAIGVVLALGLSIGLSRVLFGVQAFDPVAFPAVIALLVATAALACWLPARRATKVDPMVALRAE